MIQVHLLAQRCTVGCYDLGGIVLAAIETAVNDGLNAMTEGLEEEKNDQGGDNNGNITVLVDDCSKQVLQGKDEAEIDHGQQSGQTAIDQCAIDENVDIIEPSSKTKTVIFEVIRE